MNSGPSWLMLNHSKAVHKSCLDLCHHHALFNILAIIKISYASVFFFTALLGLAGVSGAAAAGFLLADLFS